MSNRTPPTVHAGLRGPETAPNVGQLAELEERDKAAAAARSPLQVSDLPEKFASAPLPQGDDVVYLSDKDGLRIQITSPAQRFNPATGEVTTERGIAAQFERGVFTTASLRDRLPVATIVKELESHKRYGAGKLFWRLTDMLAQARERKREVAREYLAQDPELLLTVLQDLGLTSFPEPNKSVPGDAGRESQSSS